MMNAEWKQKWIEALRSGRYKQGQNALRPDGGDTYCCLGVLCDVYDSRRWSGNAYFATAMDHRVGGLPATVQEAAELFGAQIDELISLNDGKNASFAEIAAYIEANL